MSVLPGAGGSPGSARVEAERLVATVLGTVALAARTLDVAEDCGCPFCRVVHAVREPDPQLAERLAAGAGGLASGVAGMLRTVSAAMNHHSEGGPWG